MKNIVVFSVTIFAVVLFWIIFSFHHSRTTTTVAPDLSIRIKAINPKFDQETLNSLRTRKAVPVNLDAQSSLIGVDGIENVASESGEFIIPEEESPEEASESSELPPVSPEL